MLILLELLLNESPVPILVTSNWPLNFCSNFRIAQNAHRVLNLHWDSYEIINPWKQSHWKKKTDGKSAVSDYSRISPVQWLNKIAGALLRTVTQIQRSHSCEMWAYLTSVSPGLITFQKSFEIPGLQAAGNVKHTFKDLFKSPASCYWLFNERSLRRR